MAKKEKIRLHIGIIINLTVFALSIYCLIVFIRFLVSGNQDNRFRYFTNISNLSVGAISLVSAIFLLVSIIKNNMLFPKLVSIIKFIGLSMTTLTFFTVLFVISPVTGYPAMYSGVKFITHLIIPVIAMISYLFFEEKSFFEWKYTFFGLIPFFIYSTVYVMNVVFLNTWPDLYQINTNNLWYLFLMAFYVADFAVLQGMYFLKRLTIKKDAAE